jgi:hypothetical protein
MGTWLTNNKDIIGIALAVIGLAVTAYTVATARTSQRRDAFMRMHEVLLLPEIQEGRRLLYQVEAIDDVPSQNTIEYQKINRALAIFDTLGHYVRRGHVDRREALELWHHSLVDLKLPAETFIQARKLKHRSEWTPWPRLRWLMSEAATYRSNEDCCKARQTPGSV